MLIAPPWWCTVRAAMQGTKPLWIATVPRRAAKTRPIRLALQLAGGGNVSGANKKFPIMMCQNRGYKKDTCV